jgi:CxxC-x17-CxxC domain-containing protein
MDFKKNNFRGGDRGGNFGGSRGGYKSGNDRPTEMFSAVCASCGKTCEVPFRPNGKKPVYCKECFALNGGPSVDSRNSRPSYDRPAPRRDFASAPTYTKPEYRSEPKAPNVDTGELKRSLEAMNSKLDRLVQLLTEKASPAKETSSPSLGSLVAKVSKTPAKKKAATKKKK